MWSINEVVKYVEARPEVMVLGALCLMLLYYLWSAQENWEWLDFIPHRRGKRMRKHRRDYVDMQATDDFVNAVEERVYSGIYTREEAKELYRKIKLLFPIRNLFPAPELLKENIKKRLASGTHAPVPLPDAIIKAPPKHAFDKPKLVKT